MNIRARISAAVLSVVVLSGAMVMPAQASNLESANEPDALTESAIRADLDRFGTSEAEQDLLLEKLERGIPWDSATGAKAVKSETFVENGFEVSRSYFSDGSVSETGIEIGVLATPAQLTQMISEASLREKPSLERGSTSPQYTQQAVGISSCIYGSSAGVSYASNCKVYYSGISWSSSFRADYQRWASGAAAQYRNGTASTTAFTLCVTSESVYSLEGNTRIRYAVNLAPACIGNIAFKLDLKVSSSGAYATYWT